MSKKILASILIVLGAIPFIAISGFKLINPTLFSLQEFFLSYAVIIVSFLAGIHWAIAITHPVKLPKYLLISSNFIALVAWACILMQAYIPSFIILALMFIYQLLIDQILYKEGIYQAWYKNTRIFITIVVVISILGML